MSQRPKDRHAEDLSADALLPPMATPPTPAPPPASVPVARLVTPPQSVPPADPTTGPPLPPLPPAVGVPKATPLSTSWPPATQAVPLQVASTLGSTGQPPITVAAIGTDVADSFQRGARRRRSSWVPALLSVGAAGLLVSALVAWSLQEGREEQLAQAGGRPAASTSEHSTPQPGTPPARRPAANDPAAAQVDQGPPQKRRRARPARTQQRPSPNPPATAPEDRPQASDPASTDPGAEPEPAPQTVPGGGQPDDLPSDPLPGQRANAQQVAATRRALVAARAALAKRDVPAAFEQLDLAALEAPNAELMADVERVRLLAQHVDGFWQAVRSSVAGLKVLEEIEIQGQIGTVVEADEDRLVLRLAGRNRRYQIDQLPPAIALVLAERFLPDGESKSKLYLGAFQAVDPKGDRAEALRLWQAAGQGAELALLLNDSDQGG